MSLFYIYQTSIGIVFFSCTSMDSSLDWSLIDWWLKNNDSHWYPILHFQHTLSAGCFRVSLLEHQHRHRHSDFPLSDPGLSVRLVRKGVQVKIGWISVCPVCLRLSLPVRYEWVPRLLTLNNIIVVIMWAVSMLWLTQLYAIKSVKQSYTVF